MIKKKLDLEPKSFLWEEQSFISNKIINLLMEIYQICPFNFYYKYSNKTNQNISNKKLW